MIESRKTIEQILQHVGPFQAPIRTVETHMGLVMGCNESHPLRIETETIRMLQPSQISRLLDGNMSHREMTEMIAEDADFVFIYKGRIWLGEDHYRLVDIDYEEVGFILDADLASPREGGQYRRDIDAVVGHIAIRESVKTIVGELSMDLGSYCSSYTVLLDSSPCGD